jgi:hypothetical protein
MLYDLHQPHRRGGASTLIGRGCDAAWAFSQACLATMTAFASTGKRPRSDYESGVGSSNLSGRANGINDLAGPTLAALASAGRRDDRDVRIRVVSNGGGPLWRPRCRPNYEANRFLLRLVFQPHRRQDSESGPARCACASDRPCAG